MQLLLQRHQLPVQQLILSLPLALLLLLWLLCLVLATLLLWLQLCWLRMLLQLLQLRLQLGRLLLGPWRMRLASALRGRPALLCRRPQRAWLRRGAGVVGCMAGGARGCIPLAGLRVSALTEEGPL